MPSSPPRVAAMHNVLCAARRPAQGYIFHDWAAQYDGDEWRQVGLCAARYLPQMADVPTLIICSWCAPLQPAGHLASTTPQHASGGMSRRVPMPRAHWALPFHKARLVARLPGASPGRRFDPYVGAMTSLFTHLKAAKHSEVRMVLGPWTHGDHAITYAGERPATPHALSPHAAASLRAPALDDEPAPVRAGSRRRPQRSQWCSLCRVPPPPPPLRRRGGGLRAAVHV